MAGGRWRLSCHNTDHRHPALSSFMTVSNDAFRRFQEELAAIDRKEHLPADVPVANQRLANARADFLSLRKRYGLTVADVVAFFPEEEGIAYLQQLIVASEAKPVRRRKSSAAD
ncbi:MAG TPA: 2-hydroxyacyl-CoA dehydratase [Rhodanobacter sp.]|nr:2-hydroxyacyl-CoA dehydratase [Rhodanobacter sp.]